MRNDEGFVIRHYAGAVCYQTSLFLEKNNNALQASLKSLMEDTMYAAKYFSFVALTFRNVFAKKLFERHDRSAHASSSLPAAIAAPAFSSAGNAGEEFVSSKFRSQLDVLLRKLESTVGHPANIGCMPTYC